MMVVVVLVTEMGVKGDNIGDCDSGGGENGVGNMHHHSHNCYDSNVGASVVLERQSSGDEVSRANSMDENFTSYSWLYWQSENIGMLQPLRFLPLNASRSLTVLELYVLDY
ncbi:hypothetical protein BVC80_1157g12 [Macleaya cordata]|uniref:Uncharacterized protein n=1 Tax=Macleaya cordata TaxID=56857 RepID=A0A200QR65_MACCD|nr:hypothetical protein BVC80_1157g12 [Macleaya cordata]